MKFSIISTLILPLFVSAAVHKVQVAKSGLSFSPASVKAAVGDQVAFVFDGSGHDVSQGDFGNACQPYATKPFYSGTVSSGKTWTITIDDTNPKAFYCAPHCTLGMVGVINPSGAKTLAKYKKAAKAASGSTAPSKVQGGTLS